MLDRARRSRRALFGACPAQRTRPLRTSRRGLATFGGAITGRWAGRIAAAAEASGNDAPSPELMIVIHDRRALIGSVVLMSAIVLIIFLMVFKPGT